MASTGTGASTPSGTPATVPPAPKEAREVLETIKQIARVHSETLDLARGMAETYKDLVTYQKDFVNGERLMADFSKQILGNMRARELVQDGLSSQIRSLNTSIIDAEHEKIRLQKEYYSGEKQAMRSKMYDTMLAKGMDEDGRKEQIEFIKKEFALRESTLDKMTEAQKTAFTTARDGVNAALQGFKDAPADIAKLNDALDKSKAYLQDEGALQFHITAETQKELEFTEKQIELDRLKLKQNSLLLQNLKAEEGLMGRLKETQFAAFGRFSGIVGKVAEYKQKEKQLYQDVGEDAGKMIMKSEKAIMGMNALIILAGKQMTALFDGTIRRYKELQESGEKFRYQTGFTTRQTKELDESIAISSVRLADMGVKAEDLYNATKAITDTFGTLNAVTDSTRDDFAMMSKNLGVAVEDSAAVLATFKGLSGYTDKAAIQVMNMTAELSKKAGVSFSQVMKDVAHASSDALAVFGAYPQKLMKAAMVARQMGLDLNKLGAQQKNLLDYSTSINAELEASALLGRNITFMRARQLAFVGKEKESMEETLKVVKQMGDFNSMTYYQRASIAKAAGMELADLTKALAVDKVRLEIEKSGDARRIKQLRDQDAALEQMESVNRFSKENYLNDREREITQKRMQSDLTKFKDSVSKLALAFTTMLQPVFVVVGHIADFLAWIANGIVSISESLGKTGTMAIGALALAIETVLGMALFRWLGARAKAKLVEQAAEIGKAVATALSEQAAKNAAASAATQSIGTTVAGAGATLTPAATAAAGKAGEAATSAAGGIGNISKAPVGRFHGLMRSIAQGFAEFANPMTVIGMAIVGLGIVGFALAIKQWNQIDWEKAMGGTIVLGALLAMAKLAGPAIEEIAIGAGAIALLGVALLPFGAAMEMVGKGAKNFGEGLNVAKDSIVEIIKAVQPGQIIGLGVAISLMGVMLGSVVPTMAGAGAGATILTLSLIGLGLAIKLIGNAAKEFGKGMKLGVDSIEKIGKLDVIKISKNIKDLAIALDQADEGSSSFLDSFFGGDKAIDKIKKFGESTANLPAITESVAALTKSLTGQNTILEFANAIGKLADSFRSLNTEVKAFDSSKLSTASAEVAKASGKTTTTTETKSQAMDTTNLEKVFSEKMDGVVKAISNMKVEMDGREIGHMAIKYGGVTGGGR